MNSQNIWGVGAPVGIPEGEFSTNFTETGTTGNYSVTNWTALSISQSGGATMPGAAYWKRNTLGYSQGAYWGETTPISSSSQANGVAIFDSDFMDNGGTPNAFGTGTSPSPHKGELISPRIDLSGYTDTPLAVKFYSHFRNFQTSVLGVSFSSDDGATWRTPVDYRSLTSGTPTQEFVTVLLPASSTQGVANLSQCRIKFIFDGDYYFAIIDDVTVLDGTNLSTTDFDVSEKEITLYPNPSKDLIQISNLVTNENYSILNILSEAVKKGVISDNQKIDISKFENGIYFIKFENGKTLKFIKN
ncbi:MAG: T9SS type A sorting domain-containing protein [Flavobacterium sp.]|nr:T9SS type A sorting domain-containing protein [Flavobacterium sp.]